MKYFEVLKSLTVSSLKLFIIIKKKDITMEDEEFNYIDWAKKAGLKKKITDALAKEDFTCEEVLVLLSKEDVLNLEATAGQKILLSKALAELGNPDFSSLRSKAKIQYTEPSDNSDKSEEGTTVRQPALLSRLDAQIDQLRACAGVQVGAGDDNTATVNNPQGGAANDSLDFLHKKSGDFDELTLMLAGASAGSKASMPYDYLDENQKAKVKGREKAKEVLEKDAEGRLVFKNQNANVHPLTMAEYGYASMRMGIQMLEEGKLDIEGFVRYNNYLGTIWHLAERHYWPSVLEYDSVYRQAQAARNFRWGARSHLEEAQCLVRFEDKSKRPGFKPSGPSVSNSNTGSGNFRSKKVCLQFASTGFCRYQDECRFVHHVPPNQNSNQAGTYGPPGGAGGQHDRSGGGRLGFQNSQSQHPQTNHFM